MVRKIPENLIDCLPGPVVAIRRYGLTTLLVEPFDAHWMSSHTLVGFGPAGRPPKLGPSLSSIDTAPPQTPQGVTVFVTFLGSDRDEDQQREEADYGEEGEARSLPRRGLPLSSTMHKGHATTRRAAPIHPQGHSEGVRRIFVEGPGADSVGSGPSDR